MCSEAEFPAITLSAGCSFAAFTTTRSDSSQGRVNTYLLYQEISSRISIIYLNNDSDWVISQPESMSMSRFRPLYYKDKSDATNAQYTRVLIYATHPPVHEEYQGVN